MIRAINESRGAFAEAKTDLEALKRARIEGKNSVGELIRSERYLTQAYRYQYEAYYDLFGTMRQAGAVGTQLLSISNARNLSELRLSDATKGVTEAQERANAALAIYGPQSVQYKGALEDLKTAQDGLKKATDDSSQATLAIGLTALGVFGQTGTFFLNLGKTIDKMGGLNLALTAVSKSWLIPVAVTVIGLEALIQVNQLLQDILEKQTGVKQKTVEELKATGPGVGIWPGVTLYPGALADYQTAAERAVTSNWYTDQSFNAAINNGTYASYEQMRIEGRSSPTPVTNQTTINIMGSVGADNLSVIEKAIKGAQAKQDQFTLDKLRQGIS